MSELKCPFCQQAIVCIDVQGADEYSNWLCPRCIAERKWYAIGTKTLWQELIRTRKALETLQEFVTKLYLSGKITDEQLERYKKTLKTALEQKD